MVFFLCAGSLRAFDCLHLGTHILPLILDGLLPKPQYAFICQLSELLRRLMVPTVSDRYLDSLEVCTRACFVFLIWLQEDIVKWLARAESFLPPSEGSLVFHSFMHVVEDMRRFGPCRGYWMYLFERYTVFFFAADCVALASCSCPWSFVPLSLCRCVASRCALSLSFQTVC